MYDLNYDTLCMVYIYIVQCMLYVYIQYILYVHDMQTYPERHTGVTPEAQFACAALVEDI